MDYRGSIYSVTKDSYGSSKSVILALSTQS